MNTDFSQFDRYPTDFTKLRAWMERALTDFLGFSVELPEPPSFDERQRGLLKEMKLLVIFMPGATEHEQLQVRSPWNKEMMRVLTRIYRNTSVHLVASGKWVAYEVIPKPNYSEGKYADDKLMEAIGLDTRFDRAHSDTVWVNTLEDDILPKVAVVLAPLKGKVMLQSAEEFNFLGTFLNFLREKTEENFPDLGDTASAEWCRNPCGVRDRIVIGDVRIGDIECGGLVAISSHWSGVHRAYIAFRVLVVFD